MNTQLDFFQLFAPPQKVSNYNNFIAGIKKYLFHWPLFIMALIFSLAVAFFYVNYMLKPAYEVKAAILINDETKVPDDKSAVIEQIGITNSSEVIENEIEILKSKQIISQVVKDLQLWITYKKNSAFSSDDLYNETPVKLVSLERYENSDPSQQNISKVIDIIIKDDKSFLLKNPDGKFTNEPFDASYKSNFGLWKLEPTATLARYKGSEIKILISDPDKTTIKFQKSIDATLSDKLATTIILAVSDQVAQRGKDVLNSLILNYNKATLEEKNKEAKNTLDFLEQRLASLSGELSNSEKGIENFKSSRGLTDIASDSKVDLENMQANDTRLNQAKIDLDIVNSVEQYINSKQNSVKMPAVGLLNDPTLNISIEKLSSLQLQHDQMSAQMPETNPAFEPINKQIETTKEAIRENVESIRASREATLKQLQSFDSGYESSIRNMPVNERQFVDIKREQTSKENLYTYLLQKHEEVAVKYASNLSNDRVVDNAYVEQTANIASYIYALALLLGIGLPMGIIYGRDSLGNKITNRHEINDVLKTPVICELPFQKTPDLIAIKENNINVVSEQFRALRIKLFYLHKEKESGRVTLMASSVPGEGKSFVSINLATALALAYRKTVILELDMRKPKIAEAFGLLPEHAGISDYLNQKASMRDIIQPSGIDPNLDIISCGRFVNNPSELLEKKQLNELLSKLKEEYDDIIIDSPPLHLVPDGLILSRLSDITLYIIRQGYTDKNELNFINQLVEQDQVKNMNIVFNGIERVKYGYGYKFDEKYYNNTANSESVFTPIFGDFKSRF